MSEFQDLGKGIVKRKERRVLGLFIDGTGLDHATKRLNKKINLSALVKGVTSGLTPIVARYYTIIPNEDDSRHRAFLDAVHKAGLEVIVKRLPPKGVSRQVSVDSEMAADIVAFALGHSRFSELGVYAEENQEAFGNNGKSSTGPLGFFKKEGEIQVANDPFASTLSSELPVNLPEPKQSSIKERRVITVVCPGRDLAYPIALTKELGIDTITADFGEFHSGNVLKSAAKWIDLSGSETIWRE